MIEERLLEAAPLDLDDLDGVQAAGALQTQHGVHRELGEVVLVLREDLGGQGGPGDVHQVLSEGSLVRGVVGGGSLEGRQCNLGKG